MVGECCAAGAAECDSRRGGGGASYRMLVAAGVKSASASHLRQRSAMLRRYRVRAEVLSLERCTCPTRARTPSVFVSVSLTTATLPAETASVD